jgi:hypothetical protein
MTRVMYDLEDCSLPVNSLSLSLSAFEKFEMTYNIIFLVWVYFKCTFDPIFYVKLGFCDILRCKKNIDWPNSWNNEHRKSKLYQLFSLFMTRVVNDLKDSSLTVNSLNPNSLNLTLSAFGKYEMTFKINTETKKKMLNVISSHIFLMQTK